MTQHTLSPSSRPEYPLGKDLNLLPFELFNHVKAGRLHPIDENTGLPIPRPDVSRIKRRLEAIEQEIKVLPLAYGKLQNGIVIVRGLSSRYTIDQEKQRLDGRAEKLQKEQASLKEKLKAITAFDDWTTYDPPENRQNDFDILQNARFHNDEVKSLNIETHLKSSEEPDTMPPKAPEPIEESALQPENYFNRTGNKHWAIKFGSEVAPHVDHVDGLLYIAHILNTKGGISDIQLYSIVKGGAPEANSDEKKVLANDLSNQIKFQESHDKKARQDYFRKYKQLQIDLETAESDLERSEIETEMAAMIPFLKTRNVGGQEQKLAQTNISKRLKNAYDALEHEGMKDLADHLRKAIKTANYCREYTGGIAWEIIF